MSSRIESTPAERRDDVLIVGAGVIGLMSALHLLREGRSVRVIDQDRPGAGSSHGNCGTITPSHAPPLALPGVPWRAIKWMLKRDAPLYVRPRADWGLAAWMWRFLRRCNAADACEATRHRSAILRDARHRLQQLIAAEGLRCQFQTKGSWYVFRDEKTLQHERRLAAMLAGFGIESRLIDGRSAQREEPALRDGIVGVIAFPGDASLRPDQLLSELTRKVLELGGVIESNCRYLAADAAASGVCAQTSLGLRHADWLLIASGAWSPTVLKSFGLSVPMQPGKGYSITFSRPAQVPRHQLSLVEDGVCVTAWEDGYRLGSTMEFSGYDRTLNRTRLDALVRGAGNYLHQPIGEQRLEEWYGWRPMMPDDLPLIGALPKRPRVLFAGGHGMLGVSMSTTTAQLIADHIAGRAPCIDASAFNPARWA